MYNLFTKYLLYTNTYFICIIYIFLMTFYVLVLKITNSVMLNFLCPTTIQTLIISDIFSRRTNSGILCSGHKPHVFQLSSHLPVLGHIYSHTNLVGTTLSCNTCFYTCLQCFKTKNVTIIIFILVILNIVKGNKCFWL